MGLQEPRVPFAILFFSLTVLRLMLGGLAPHISSLEQPKHAAVLLPFILVFRKVS